MEGVILVGESPCGLAPARTELKRKSGPRAVKGRRRLKRCRARVNGDFLISGDVVCVLTRRVCVCFVARNGVFMTIAQQFALLSCEDLFSDLFLLGGPILREARELL